jgi:hypothetical protein
MFELVNASRLALMFSRPNWDWNTGISIVPPINAESYLRIYKHMFNQKTALSMILMSPNGSWVKCGTGHMYVPKERTAPSCNERQKIGPPIYQSGFQLKCRGRAESLYALYTSFGVGLSSTLFNVMIEWMDVEREGGGGTTWEIVDRGTLKTGVLLAFGECVNREACVIRGTWQYLKDTSVR